VSKLLREKGHVPLVLPNGYASEDAMQQHWFYSYQYTWNNIPETKSLD